MPDEIRRRDEDDTEREVSTDRTEGRPAPGGAEGGDESNSASWLIDHPDDTDPLGDTDQHSDPDNLPPHRDQANRDRGSR